MHQLRAEQDNEVRLSNAEIEAVTRRFFEREEERRKEAERIAALPTVGDVAQILGADADVIESLVQDVRRQARPKTAETSSQPRLKLSGWYLAYVIVLALCLGATFHEARAFPAPPPVSGREIPSSPMFSLQPKPVVARDLVSPPSGITLTVGDVKIAPSSNRGLTSTQRAVLLKRSVLAAILYCDRTRPMSFWSGPSSYKDLPMSADDKTASDSSYNLLRNLVLTDGRKRASILLPARTTNTKEEAKYKAEISRRVEWLFKKPEIAQMCVHEGEIK